MGRTKSTASKRIAAAVQRHAATARDTREMVMYAQHMADARRDAEIRAELAGQRAAQWAADVAARGYRVATDTETAALLAAWDAEILAAQTAQWDAEIAAQDNGPHTAAQWDAISADAALIAEVERDARRWDMHRDSHGRFWDER